VPPGASGVSAHYSDPAKSSDVQGVQGVGIESYDIIRMTDEMIRDMLAHPFWSASESSPKVIIDSEYFINEGSTRINKRLITDRMRVELNKAARGQLIFIGREYLNMILKEAELKQLGLMGQEKTIDEIRIYEADYRLGGRISSMDAINPKTGAFSRFHQILFEMINLKTGAIVWSGSYSFKKTAQEDIIYR
jgi:hypothetical protein